MIELIKLHAYVDGELSDSERREVESRLAGCSASRAEVNSIIGLKSTLKGHSEVDCSDVWNRARLDSMPLIESLSQATSSQNTLGDLLPRSLLSWLLAAGMPVMPKQVRWTVAPSQVSSQVRDHRAQKRFYETPNSTGCFEMRIAI